MSAPSPPEPLSTPWARAAREVSSGLDVDPSVGLPEREVHRRAALFGPNALRETRRRSAWVILAAQFASLLVGLLTAAMVTAMLFGEWVEATAILAVLLINATIGFLTELQAARSMESLRRMGATEATVRRAGRPLRVPARALVPGDIVLLEGGDVVTADLRLVEASKLQADESTFTGESLPVSKSVAPVALDAALADRTSMLFKGTVVTRGSAVAVVVGTGMESELGRISRLVEEAKEEQTPLEKRLDGLGHGLVWATLAIATLVAVSGHLAGKPLFLVIETAIALAVAAVPEGLPIIATIALARGMHRMARHRALVNRLSAVETLGATSVVCTDKTGTLTENRIRVHLVRGVDAVPDAERVALELGALCNNAALTPEGRGVGDPLEVALLAAAVDRGIDLDALRARLPERREVAFDAESKLMATVHGAAPPYKVAVKGAPEEVLAACDLDEAGRAHWNAESERLAEEGLRVIGVAEGDRPEIEGPVYSGLRFVGLVGMLDPPRAGVRETVEACGRAGVRLVMVTGDHPVTARNIAAATGLVPSPDVDVVTGAELRPPDQLTDPERARLLAATVTARVSPRQKLDLIALHQSAGAVVAMTGDGVNDAPALRKADIGVAMGARGTAAAKEAAAMVLQDDDLSTIVLAIREGRVIFDNIRNFVVYLLSCNLSEVLVVAVAALAGAPLPLLPLQILFLNLVTDVFPALALGVGEGGAQVMQRPPRPASEPIVGARHWRSIIGYGVLLTASVLLAFTTALGPLGLGPDGAVTVSFLTLSFAQLWHVFNLRRPGGGLHNEITGNPWLWGALVVCVALVLLAVYLPPLARLLSIVPPSSAAWGVVLGASVLPLLLGQIHIALRGAR